MLRPVTFVAALGALAAVTLLVSSCLAMRNAIAPSRAGVVAADVPYVRPVERGAESGVDDKQRLDVWAPADAHDAPVVIFVHGGYWNSGDRRYFDVVTGLYGAFGRALGAHDIVTVIPSYRLFPQVDSVEPMLDDIAAVVRWTHAHIAAHGGSPERIVLAGHSAGGHLVLQLVTAPDALARRGVEPSWVKGVAPISGIFDVVRSTRQSDAKTRAALWEPLFGARPDDWSPLRRLAPTLTRSTPLLFFVGSRDEDVCLLDFADARAALADVDDTQASFRTVEGNTHRDMVLEIDGPSDEVTPHLAAFVHRVTSSGLAPPPSSSSPTGPPSP
jgi:acetyl esterase/lipase